MTINFFATTPKGLELLLADELRELGAVKAAEKLAGVEFTGDLSLAYKVCLWSRFANRILLPLKKFHSETPEQLYAGVQKIDWSEHIDHNGTISVTFNSVQSEITHTLFGSQKVKDAIVDQLRDKFSSRPDVVKEQPDVRINLYLYRNEATVSIDLSGESLHRRGYRQGGGAAPLKENLAAAILKRGGWPSIAQKGGTFIDPLCGSGTLLIEAALMASNTAPGLYREYFGFLGWKKHTPAVWEELWHDAEIKSQAGMEMMPEIIGFDSNTEAVTVALENIAHAKLTNIIQVKKRDLQKLTLEPHYKTGLIATNPPYGERIGELSELPEFYTLLGSRLKLFIGWQAAVFMGNPDLGKTMGVRAKKFYALFNGAIACKLLLFDLIPEKFIDRTHHKD